MVGLTSLHRAPMRTAQRPSRRDRTLCVVLRTEHLVLPRDAPTTVYLYGMKPLHTRFAQEYLVDRNGAAAAVRAGYAPRAARQQAYELLTRPDVAEAVRTGEAEIAAHAQVTRTTVLSGLQEAIEIGRSRSDPSAMIAGWREVAKMCGYYAPERKQIELSTAGLAVRAEIEEMSDVELANLIASAPASH